MRHRSFGKLALASTLIAGLMLSLGLSVKAAPALFAKASPSVQHGNVVALGDSITFGYNLGDNQAPSKLAFPFIVGRETGLPVVDLATPGWTTTDLLTALQTEKFQHSLQQAALVTVDIGSNDLLHVSGALIQQALLGQPIKVSSEEAQSIHVAELQASRNIPLIIQAIRKQTGAPIMLLDIYDPFTDGSPLHATVEQMVSAVNRTIHAQSECIVVNAYSSFNHKQAAFVLPLDVHPTISGQQALANAVMTDINARPSLLSGYEPQVVHRPAHLKLSSSHVELAARGRTTITGVLQDVYGSPVSNAVVDFTVSAGKITPTITSGKNGRFKVTYTAPSKPGQVTVQGRVRGTKPRLSARLFLKIK